MPANRIAYLGNIVSTFKHVYILHLTALYIIHIYTYNLAGAVCDFVLWACLATTESFWEFLTDDYHDSPQVATRFAHVIKSR